MNKTFHDPFYTSGEFSASSLGSKDAKYKIEWIETLLTRNKSEFSNIEKVADIGCGSGQITNFLFDMFISFGSGKIEITGYDIHPGVMVNKKHGNVKFLQGDFLNFADHIVDMVFLVDVIEHVVEPQKFINTLLPVSRWAVFHIPLDDAIFTWMRNLPKIKLKNPGHITILNPASALNLITNAGFRIIDFEYTPVFNAPTGRETKTQKLLNPLRSLLFKISPYLLSKTLGGVSLLVLARSSYNW